jgi:hypothetical protein
MAPKKAKPYTGEGFAPGSAQALAVRGEDADMPRCTCPKGWKGEGHHEDCPLTRDDTPAVACACPPTWKGEGHAPECPKAAEVRGASTAVCTCPPKWKGEGHHEDCAKGREVRGTADDASVCTCASLEWTDEGHAPECPLAA